MKLRMVSKSPLLKARSQSDRRFPAAVSGTGRDCFCPAVCARAKAFAVSRRRRPNVSEERRFSIVCFISFPFTRQTKHCRIVLTPEALRVFKGLSKCVQNLIERSRTRGTLTKTRPSALSSILEWRDELHKVVIAFVGRFRLSPDLNIPPTQLAVDAVQQ